MPTYKHPVPLPLPLSEETAYGIWAQLRTQIQNTPMAELHGDPLNKAERELYDTLTRRFLYEAAVVGITMEDKAP